MGMKNGANKSQKGQQVPNFTEDQARAFFEQRRWPNGPGCVHCGSVNVYRLGGQSQRPGLFECRDCKGNFTVMVGTVMEDTHLPLSVWVKAFHFMASSKKGMSALQLQRNLGIGSYRTAWHLAHRIRYAMKTEPTPGMLKNEVQADETYVGGSPRQRFGKKGETIKAEKTPVVVLVETGGRACSRVVETVDANSLHAALQAAVHKDATVVTDEARAYIPIVNAYFGGGHQTVNHSRGVYVNAEGFTTNAAESYFALLKRGVYGTFHHVSKQHLHRYCAEFDFRWNGRDLMDSERRDAAVKGAEGKRLMYRHPTGVVWDEPGIT
jgi:transposase-like protein